jgi:hypothetical protein
MAPDSKPVEQQNLGQSPAVDLAEEHVQVSDLSTQKEAKAHAYPAAHYEIDPESNLAAFAFPNTFSIAAVIENAQQEVFAFATGQEFNGVSLTSGSVREVANRLVGYELTAPLALNAATYSANAMAGVSPVVRASVSNATIDGLFEKELSITVKNQTTAEFLQEQILAPISEKVMAKKEDLSASKHDWHLGVEATKNLVANYVQPARYEFISNPNNLVVSASKGAVKDTFKIGESLQRKEVESHFGLAV